MAYQYVIQQSVQQVDLATEANIQAEIMLNSARVQLAAEINQWMGLAGSESIIVQSANSMLASSNLAEINRYITFFQQVNSVVAYCTNVLDYPSPALSQNLGTGNLQSLQQDVYSHINVIANSRSNQDRSQSVIHLQRIQSQLVNANNRLAESARPVSELNQQIDGKLLTGEVAGVPETGLDFTTSLGGVYHTEAAWYISTREQVRDQYQIAEGPKIVAGPPPEPELSVAEKINAGTNIESLPAHPIHLALSIERSTSGFRAKLFEEENELVPLSIRLNLDEVRHKGKQIRETIGKLFKKAKIKTYFYSQKVFDQAEMEKDWKELVDKGTTLLTQIFDEASLAEFRNRLGVYDGSSDQPMRSLRIGTEDFFLPWEMLAWPPTSQNEPLERRLWGFQYNITRSVKDAGMTITKPRLIADTRPDMLFFALTEEDRQAIMLRHLGKKKRVNLNEVQALTTDAKREEEIAVLPAILAKKIHVVHFGCHAYGAGEELNAGFVVKKDFHLTLNDIHGIKLTGNPLVFLNACETGITNEDPLNPKAAADFVRVFLRDMGACGVIATEYEVPEGFAPDFAYEFYINFLGGEFNAGDALLRARQEFLRKRNNPLGLFFSAYLEPETRVFIQPQGAQQ